MLPQEGETILHFKEKNPRFLSTNKHSVVNGSMSISTVLMRRTLVSAGKGWGRAMYITAPWDVARQRIATQT